MMGKLNFFLRLQIKQHKDDTFMHQSKYTKDVLKKFEMSGAKPLTTSMATTAAFDVDEEGEPMARRSQGA